MPLSKPQLRVVDNTHTPRQTQKYVKKPMINWTHIFGVFVLVVSAYAIGHMDGEDQAKISRPNLSFCPINFKK